MRWAEMHVQCRQDAVDAVSYAFLEAGCGGVVLQGVDPVTVQGSLPVNDGLEERLVDLRSHLARLPEFGLPAIMGQMTIRYAEDADWANAWKKHFKPSRIGRSIVIKPSWELYDPEPGDVVLELDPGMAFGTGGHPTTRLCLQALEDYVSSGMTVADVGTGSGILALAAARLGAQTVYATDIDLLPRKIARENVARNSLEAVIDVAEPDEFSERARECDLVVCNIVANTIITLAPVLAPALNPSGLFIASGIVEEGHDAVCEALAAAGMIPFETRREDIWVCITARKESA